MARGVAYVEYDVGRVVVEFEFHEELIERLKEAIPPRDRSWDGVRKAWVFTPDRWPEARRIIGEYLAIED